MSNVRPQEKKMLRRRKSLLTALALGSITLFGCSDRHESEQFKLVPSPSGELYRIQSTTGTLHKVQGGTLFRVAETDRIQLRPGQVYVFENGSHMKYLGDGKFEPFKADVVTLDEYLKTHEGSK